MSFSSWEKVEADIVSMRRGKLDIILFSTVCSVCTSNLVGPRQANNRVTDSLPEHSFIQPINIKTPLHEICWSGDCNCSIFIRSIGYRVIWLHPLEIRRQRVVHALRVVALCAFWRSSNLYNNVIFAALDPTVSPRTHFYGWRVRTHWLPVRTGK